MKRFLIILIIIVVFAGVAIAGVFLYLRPDAPAPVTGQQTTAPADNSTVPVSTSSSDQAAVRAAYLKALSKGNPDNVKAGQTVVSGNYALQVWVGDITGGQALLMLDATQHAWTIVDPGGGAWSVQSLVGAGVPTSTAQSLLAQISR